MSADDRYLQCRFCSWRTLKWRKNQSGAVKSGWPRLEDHLEQYHPAEYAAIYPRSEPEVRTL